MKKSAVLVGAALAGLGAVLVAPSAVGDPRISVPFKPVAVPMLVPTEPSAVTRDALRTGLHPLPDPDQGFL